MPVDGLNNLLRTLGPGRLAAMALVVLGLPALLYYASTRLTTPALGLLYSDLEMAESAEIVERLQSQNVRFELRDGGRTILVPQEQVSALRVGLAGEGLGGSIVGYEIFDRGETLGTTSFVQNVNRLRAIEGELARTIREIDAVSSARVHIVLPERQLFGRQQREPSASIVLRTGRGGVTNSQVAAIQYLVASAVPGLTPQKVSIVDQSGALLARSSDTDAAENFLASAEDRRRTFESRLRTQIESLLERTVGVGRVRAEVSAEMDLNRITTNEEIYDPDSQVVRSSSTVEETSRDEEGLSGEVTVGNNLPDGEEGEAEDDGSLSTSGRTEEVVNYEISRTVRTQVKEGGEIQRISVAVLVDGSYTTAADGTTVYQPRSEAELERLAALVRSAIGFDAERGDTVEVVNLQFVTPEPAELAPEPDSFLGLNSADLFGLVEKIVFGIVIILALLLIVRPIVNRLLAATEPVPAADGPQQLETHIGAAPAIAGPDPTRNITPELAAAAAAGDPDAAATVAAAKEAGVISEQGLSIDAEIDVARVEGRVQDSALKKVGEIVQGHPEEAAAIVRQWLYSD